MGAQMNPYTDTSHLQKVYAASYDTQYEGYEFQSSLKTGKTCLLITDTSYLEDRSKGYGFIWCYPEDLETYEYITEGVEDDEV